MEQGVLKHKGIEYAPRTTEESMYPNIDSSYLTLPYKGERIRINTENLTLGYKVWSSTPDRMQGVAIYNDLLVRMANVATSTTHYIYRIGESGVLTLLATFTLSTTGHSNTLQFAPTIEDGQTYPYLYVSDLNGGCEVLSISANYAVEQVQKITIPTGWQAQIGDDGFIWAIVGTGLDMRFIKYRKVAVSEGDVTLTTDDILADIPVYDSQFDPSFYTFQGSKIKFGKAWLPIGTTGANQKRALFVFDLAEGRTFANIDLTDIGNVEFEDLDFWDNACVIMSYSATNYILRF